jgi:hypothetical protein
VSPAPRIFYKVLSVDPAGNGVAADRTYDGFRFKVAPGKIDPGDMISGIADLADATHIVEVVIETGRNREGERSKFESVAQDVPPTKPFGEAITGESPAHLRSRDDDLLGKKKK